MKKNLFQKYDAIREYYNIVKPILEHEEFQKRKLWPHHGNTSLYDHCLKVSFLAYEMSLKFKTVDSRSVAIGGLLHDFYYRPWMDEPKNKPLLQKHGFVHAKEARDNSYNYFYEYMNPKIENIILRHMFPLNKVPPKYKEAWLVTLADKIASIDFFEKETILRTLGLKKGR